MMHPKKETAIRLRPHHLICNTYLPLNGPERGEAFDRTMRYVREVMTSHEDSIVEVIEGVDYLCATCPDCKGSRCESPQGNEDAVRKWDLRILKSLDLSYGEKKPSGEIRSLIELNAPFEFCRNRCPWKAVCNIFKK
ncbi:MAG: DUF1284 domain-containing protein [Syntrophaceae bacterium]